MYPSEKNDWKIGKQFALLHFIFNDNITRDEKMKSHF